MSTLTDVSYKFFLWPPKGDPLEVIPPNSSWHGDPVQLAKNIANQHNLKVTVEMTVKVTGEPDETA